MKKSSLIIASAMLLGSAAFTSCVQDTLPQIEKPTQFVLNVPPMSENVYILNADTKIDFTWSQPNYGLGVVPNYYVQISQYPEFKDANGEEALTELPTAYTSAHATVPGSELASTLQEMYGWETAESMPADPVTIYARVKSEIPNWAEGTIISNTIAVSVISYFVNTAPDEIWLIGQCQGWNIASADGWALYETEMGSKVYKGAFDIPAGEFQFRFYDKLGDWEHNSIGSQDEDASIEISMATGSYTGDCFFDPATEKAGKGSWSDPDWGGGLVSITVDLNTMKVSFVAGAVADEIYIVGACNGWDINSDALKLVEKPAGSGVYQGTVSVAADQFCFRFYSELGDWDKHNIGCAEVQGDENYDIPGLPYNGACVAGDGNDFKGKWNCPTWAGGEVEMTVDLKAMTVSFVAVQ